MSICCPTLTYGDFVLMPLLAVCFTCCRNVVYGISICRYIDFESLWMMFSVPVGKMCEVVVDDDATHT